MESVFAALKERRGRGGSLRSRTTHTQDRELAIQTISYNIDMVTRKAIEEGRLTRDALEAMAISGPGHARADTGGRLAEDDLRATAAD